MATETGGEGRRRGPGVCVSVQRFVSWTGGPRPYPTGISIFPVSSFIQRSFHLSDGSHGFAVVRVFIRQVLRRRWPTVAASDNFCDGGLVSSFGFWFESTRLNRVNSVRVPGTK
ncbi:hypothetical protein HanPI659440_Chr01g0013491 [Helianthus annuus]|nr:hypothetical protein HanPI659440_Chr01g0013491 [Helianthus annuus]